MKFRIIYKVTRELPGHWTEKNAMEFLEDIGDEVDVFAAEAAEEEGNKVAALLQVWVPMPTEALPNNGQWSDLHSV
jgi:hypothetical protein